MPRLALTVSTLAYVVAVVTANYLTNRYGFVSAGFGLLVTAGTYSAGAALLARDFVHRHATATFGRRRGIVYVLALIGVAGIASWVLSSPALATASTVAFLGAELVDMGVFSPVRDRWGFLPAALVSNVVSAPIDTVLFLALAGFPITWQAVTGQFIAKVLWVTVLPLLLWALVHARDLRTLRAA